MNRKAWLFALLVLSFILTACGSAPAPAGQPSTGGFDPDKFVGTYVGEWKNETTGASGSSVITVTADKAAKTATVTLDFGGNYLGLGDPPAVTVSANYTDEGAIVQGNNVLLGDMDVRVDPEGNITGTFKNIAGGTIPYMTYTGKIGNGRLDTDYEVTLKDGTTTRATVRSEEK